MARARNIKPALFSNDELAEIDPLGRLLFIGLWTIADFKGDLEWREKRIKAQLLPYDNCSIKELAINLDKSGFIRFYSVGGTEYLNIVNFTKHQNPHKNEREKGSEIPSIEKRDSQDVDLSGITINHDKNGTTQDKNETNRADSLNLIPDSLSLIPDTKDLMSDNSDAVFIIEYMNGVLGTKYKSNTASHIQNVNARLKDGHSINDLKLVVDFKFKDWGGDPKMSGYLRPQTLFQTGKFQGYLTAAKTTPSGQHRNINEISKDFSAPAGFKPNVTTKWEGADE